MDLLAGSFHCQVSVALLFRDPWELFLTDGIPLSSTTPEPNPKTCFLQDCSFKQIPNDGDGIA
jgi:hypothetical protein